MRVLKPPPSDFLQQLRVKPSMARNGDFRSCETEYANESSSALRLAAARPCARAHGSSSELVQVQDLAVAPQAHQLGELARLAKMAMSARASSGRSCTGLAPERVEHHRWVCRLRRAGTWPT